MVVFQNRLYVRHGNGQIDAFDGVSWSKNVFATLPRKEVSALATDGRTLYLAQWGGWSVWNGRTFTHHLNIPVLQGVPITSLCPVPADNRLWIGTQGKGLAEGDIATGSLLRWHNEQNGLTDDWVTEIASVPSPHGARLLVGTFVGGLCERDVSGNWQIVPGTAGENITGIARIGNETVAATRHGIRPLPSGSPTLPVWLTGKTIEAQCLCPGDTGLWIGTRTGIYFAPDITGQKIVSAH